MKCIKMKSGVIVRVPDDHAAQLVRENQGSYTTKSEYKRYRNGQLPPPEAGKRV